MSLDPQASYYDVGGIEAIAVIRAKLTREQFTGFLLGCSLKYAMRLNHKGTPDRDAEKARFYTSMLNEHLAYHPVAGKAKCPTCHGTQFIRHLAGRVPCPACSYEVREHA